MVLGRGVVVLDCCGSLNSVGRIYGWMLVYVQVDTAGLKVQRNTPFSSGYLWQEMVQDTGLFIAVLMGLSSVINEQS